MPTVLHCVATCHLLPLLLTAAAVLSDNLLEGLALLGLSLQGTHEALGGVSTARVYSSAPRTREQFSLYNALWYVCITCCLYILSACQANKFS